MGIEYDRDMPYEDEEEIEKALDDFIEYINEATDPERESVRIINPNRIDNVRLCAAVLEKFTGGEGLHMECELHKPIESSAYISLEGETISMDDTRWLPRVGKLANNMEVYPLTTGGVKLTFMFYGITKEMG